MFGDALIAQHWMLYTTIIGVIVALIQMGQPATQMIKKKSVWDFPALIVVGLVTVWIGARPLWAYTDTKMYTTIFQLVQSGQISTPEVGNEWLFLSIEEWFIKHSGAQEWLAFIALIYVGCAVSALWRWMPGHLFLALIFLFCSFSFFSYGTNGIRNGMATSIAMLGLSLIYPWENKSKLVITAIGFIVIYLSIGVHATMALIFGAALIALFYKQTNVYCTLWLTCIFLSLVFTEPLKELLGFLIDDGRLTIYAKKMETDNGMFSRTGFRWDFILYSAVPVALGYYAIVKKGVQDATYIFLTNVYIIANSFWCLINSAAYSNRFAYLSWFLMPILICYPLVKFRLFDNQGLVCGMFLLGSVIFNWLF